MREDPTATVSAAPALQTPRGRLPQTRSQLALRALGALAVIAVGAVHLDQYYVVYYRVVPIIGHLFVLNFAGATVLGLLLLLPVERLVDRLLGRGGRTFVTLLALGAIALAAVAFVFLFVSESTTLLGFREHGYRTAIIVSLTAEAATAVLLAGYLGSRLRRR